MTLARSEKSGPQIVPLIILVVGVLIILKAANIWVGFSAAGATTSATTGATGFWAGRAGVSAPEAERNQPAAQTPGVDEPDLYPQDRGSEPRILERLGARHKALDVRESALDLREELLAAAEVQLEQRAGVFRVQKAALMALEERREAAKSEELKGLISAYERMKPRDAARIFEVLEDQLLVSVAADMRTQALSGVLAQMAPERAHTLTRLMAERNKIEAEHNAPDQ